jgi:hypothetical protein
VVHLGSVPIDRRSTLSAEVAVAGVEIERTDAVFAASTLELYSPFYPIGRVVCHRFIVVPCSEGRMHHGGLSKVTGFTRMSVKEIFRQLPSELLTSAPKCAMLRAVFLSFIGVVCMCLCCCTNPRPPRTLSPSLPLANRVAKPDARKYATYSRTEWYEWKNPILVISTQGIQVLISHEAHGPKVEPESVGAVLERTRPSDWPFGLIVMLEMAGLDSGNRDKAEKNRAVLVRTLETNGIQFVWGPPSA